MQNVKEAWDALNAGKEITDGEIVASYKNGKVICEPYSSSIIPFHADNIEDWEVVVPQGEMYCRWYIEDKAGITISTTFFKVEEVPTENWAKMEEAFTREEILGI